MGTRNLTAVIHNGEYKIAQYGQWDGYPECQGETARAFLAVFDRERFIARLAQCRWITQEEYDASLKEAGHKGGDWITRDVSVKFHELQPYLSRDHGANILWLVHDSEGPVLLMDRRDFAGDSLFCEWAYVIDLDKNTFEVYEGYNKEPLNETERFAKAQPYVACESSKYHPVRHLITFALDALPTKEKFLEAINAVLKEREKDVS